MSAIYQKAEFYEAAIKEMASGNYPELSARLAAGDVTVTQQLGAMAQMAAMLSYQVGLAVVEPWIKARDNMVMADASVKGILPYATPTAYAATVVNRGNSELAIETGRRLLDNKGRIWTVASGGKVKAGGRLDIGIEQYEARTQKHTVKNDSSFYSIPISAVGDGSYLAAISIKHQDGTWFKEQERFTNIDTGDRVFSVISDELLKINVVFGCEKAGYIPNIGEELTLLLRYSFGDVVLNDATPLELEYIKDGEEVLEIFSGKKTAFGKNPHTIEMLRKMTDYPSLYDPNAVFLGEFDFLIKRKLSPFVFLSVWNEAEEEKVRGANQSNVNTLFVSFVKDDMSKTEVEKRIKDIVSFADNSYKIRFVSAKEEKIKLNVKLYLAPMHDAAEVSKQVKEILLSKYGRQSGWGAKNKRINIQNTVKLLREKITQLQDGISDIDISVSMTAGNIPEVFRYVDDAGISIQTEALL